MMILVKNIIIFKDCWCIWILFCVKLLYFNLESLNLKLIMCEREDRISIDISLEK